MQFKTPTPVAAKRVTRRVPYVAPRPPIDSWRRGFSRKAAQDYYDEKGFLTPEMPPEVPMMPSDITALQSHDLGRLYGQYIAWCDYLEDQVALLGIDAGEEAAYLVHVEADIRLRKSGTVKDKDSKAVNDSRYIAQEQNSLSAQAKYKLLLARLKGYERCAAALSREQSRREPRDRNV